MQSTRLPTHCSRRKEQGFTLTELLVAMALTGVVMASLYSAHLSQQRAYQVNENVTVVQQNLRSAMYFLEKDLRMAGYDPKETGEFRFHAISQDGVRFSLDRDENGKLEDTDYIEYDFRSDNNTLRRKVGTDSFQPIASEISGVDFSFFIASGVTTFDPTAHIRSVGITIHGSRGGHTRELRSRVVCRNLGL